MLVEPACGAGLAAVYQRVDSLQICVTRARKELGIAESLDVVGTGAEGGGVDAQAAALAETRPVVVEVCGGALVTATDLLRTELLLSDTEQEEL